MDKKEEENYIKAGEILKKARENAKKSILPGQKLLDIAEKIEKEINSLHGKPAFPVNLSLNNAAAHYTPSAGDSAVLGEKDVMKVDIGVHIDGYIADCAFTLNPAGNQKKIVEASENALQNALKILKEGITLGEIGEAIEKTIKQAGFNPVQNLNGHGLQQYNQHASPSIPNIGKKDSRKLEGDMVFAIEPFATDGEGFVRDAAQSEIFQLDEPKPVRNAQARKILEFVMEEYKTLPFAERWIANELKLSEFQRKIAMRELLMKKCISAFPVLREAEGKIVSQAETSVMLKDGKITVLI